MTSHDSQNYTIQGEFITRQHLKQSLLNNTLTRNILYFLQSFFVSFLIFINRFLNKKNKTFKYTISICGMFKNESKFLDEWIRFHLVIGIDHFYLYNNNSDDNFLEILQPYIDKGIVDLIDWPYYHSQMQAYEDCYNKFKSESNWLTFIDIDEFICPVSTDNIKTWLESFRNYPGVAVYWKQFGSNGKLTHDNNQLVIEQYTQCWPKHSSFTKMFCNMNFFIYKFENPHVINSSLMGIIVPPINQFKKIISYGINRTSRNNKSTIQINHYWGKAYDTFFESKVNRTDVYHDDDQKMSQIRLSLLKSHESMCTQRDYTIHRYLLYTKLKNIKTE